ncbi:MAG TPA: hypothetical protein PLW50_00770 [Smithellaceae bacterium]|nr:hypothetical protein [Smithellaceae bacterium]
MAMGNSGGGPAIRPIHPVAAAAIADFRALKHQDAGGIIVKLFDILLNDCRIENDTAEPNAVIRNQGRIDILLRIKSLLERDYPTQQ